VWGSARLTEPGEDPAGADRDAMTMTRLLAFVIGVMVTAVLWIGVFVWSAFDCRFVTRQTQGPKFSRVKVVCGG
jgi:hypothetical protein